MKQISKILVALAVTFINLNLASAQLNGTGGSTTAPNSSSSSTPNASFAPPANPQAWCEAGGYCDGNATPPPATPQRAVRPPQPRWHVVVNGDLEGSRQHDEVETGLGHVEYGIGGTVDCHEETTGMIGVTIAPSSLRYLQGETGHRFVDGTFCMIRGTVGPINIDLTQYVTITMFETLIRRVEDLERRVGEHDTMILSIGNDGDSALETIYRRDCADKMDTVSFQQWLAATPAERIALCPQVVVDNDGRDRYFELQFGAGGVLRNTNQRTLLGLDVSLQLTHLGDEGRGFFIQTSGGFAGAVAQHGLPHREFSRFMLVGASLGYAQRLGHNTSRVMLGIGAAMRMTFVLPDPDRPGSIPDGYIGTQAGVTGFVSVDLARSSNHSNIRPFLRLDASALGGRETIYTGGNSERSLTLPAGFVSEFRLTFGGEFR